MQCEQVEQSISTQPSKKQKVMGHLKQGSDASTSTEDKSKRARKQSAPVQIREKVPPLFVKTTEIGMLRDELARMQIYPLFKLCSTGIKIMCSSLLDYGKVKQELTAGEFQFYTHDIPSSKPLKVIIRGLNCLLETELRKELERLHLQPQRIFTIVRKDQTGEYRDQLCLVHFAKGSTTLAALRQIRALFSLVVEWEAYRPRHRDVTQCMNCLGFGHGTRNCNMNARCDKCAGNHVTMRIGHGS
ncbi:uncharacterized protein LOC129717292 [Wyeomyia smithii]|uniref:uncharacterized protein LOC129717292 n=1 Tax=Wyeomyia smithii TaxID=174621 RepID=UPI0024680C9B|nr:uncharacterized protein LOC129717292 [Wyeomyia smithii]